jgi:hypothetical protein
MAAFKRHWILAGLILATWMCMACDPLSGLFFLVAEDPQFEPEFKLTLDDSNPSLNGAHLFKDSKKVKVVILTSTQLAEIRTELLGADRELSTLFTQKLNEGFRRNNENVVLASSSKVQKFKDSHPQWQSLSLEEVGKQLDTDFVVDLEINQLSLYESGSQNTFFRGKASISLTVADMHKLGENPVYSKEFVTEYPKSQGPQLLTDTNPQKFRRDFLARVATELSWIFTAHPTAEQYNCE